MRPIKLIMSAFGPYADKIILDMTKLGDRGIYLVTGDTGAGKTTIFDAICYALYGQASGELRSADLFRSKYATKETPTFVEMEFLYRNEIYVVRRNPEYERPALRGEGMATQDASASLTYPDGRVISKVKDVNNAIVELLGLDRKQFSQIAMIAQGDFLKLIMARTEERRDIFREIFNTKLFLVLQEKLKASSGELHNQYDELCRSVKQYLTGIDIEETDINYEELRGMVRGTDIPSVTKAVEYIEAIIKADKTSEKLMNKTIKESEIKLEEINAKIIKATTIEQLKKDLLEVEQEIAKSISKTEQIEQEYRDCVNNDKQIGELAVQIAKDKSSLNEIIKYNELLKESKRIQEYVKGIEKGKVEYVNKTREIDEKVKKIRLYLEQNSEEDIKECLTKISEQKQVANERTIIINNIKNMYKQYCDSNIEYSKLKEEYIKARDVYETVNVKVQEAERIFLDERAGVLASTLQDNMPCPVCGSTTHPNKAKLSDKSISKEQLDDLKKDREQKEKKYNSCSELAGRKKGSLDSIQASLIEECKKNLDIDNIENIHKSIEVYDASRVEFIAEIRRKEEELNKREQIRKENLKLLGQYEEEANTIKEKMTNIEGDIIKNNEAIVRLDNQLVELQGKLETTDLEQVEKLILDKEKRKSKLEDDFDKAKKAYEANKEYIYNLNNKKSILTKQLKESEIIRESLDNLNASREGIREQLNDLRETKENKVAKLKTNKQAVDNINDKLVKVSEIEEKWNMVKALSNTANGNITGKKKILLETYVQMSYFDRIIIRANTRLMRMSTGQYELIRKEDVKDSRSQIGLELDVIDHYNKTNRSVKSLSGGEAFKASLALALGLSDEIQSISGGIQLDTMFIDEGFGSLDDESLDCAIKTLCDLGKGNKLIGIISHVSELKNRIDKQILVTKTKEGSNAHIVY